MFIIVAGTIFIQILVDLRETSELDRTDAMNLEHYWSTLPRAALTLFEAISGGVSWDEIVSPLMDISPKLGVGFCMYVAFSTLALMNVITGIFVNGAITSADSEKAKQAANALHKAFDADNTGHVSREEF